MLRYTAASGNQPSGHCVPSLLPALVDTMASHVMFARSLNPQRQLLRVAAPDFSWKIGLREKHGPTDLPSVRKDAMRFLRETSAKLAPQNPAAACPDERGRSFQAPKLCADTFLACRLNHPDRHLARDLSFGMQIVGQVPPVGVFKARLREPQIDYELWKSQVPARNREMIRRVVAEKDTEISKIFWKQTLGEAAHGWVTTPVPVTENVIGNFPLSPRFAQEENRGNQGKKIRIIGDFKASKVNDLLGLSDTSVPETLDVFLSMLLLNGHFRPHAEIVAFSMDFSHAYNHIGISADRLDFATVVLADTDGVPHMASLRTQPFGSRRAPANWARVTALLQAVLT